MSAFAAAFPAAASRHRASTYGASASLGANAHAARYTSRHTLSSRSAFGWFEVCFRTWQYHSSRIRRAEGVVARERVQQPFSRKRLRVFRKSSREEERAGICLLRGLRLGAGFFCTRGAPVVARVVQQRAEQRRGGARRAQRLGGGGERDSGSATTRATLAALGSSARGRRRASAERQNPKHPRSSRFFPAGSETEDFVKCVAAYASNGSRASWTRSESNAKTTGSGSGTEAFRAERRRVASRRSLSALFSSNPDVRPARSLNDSLIIKPGGTLSRLRSASSFALDTALGSARARSSAFVAFVRGHRGTSAPDFVAARARISRARLRARNPRARACSVVAARSSAAAAANGLCLSSAFSFPGSEGRPRSDIERRDDARARAGVGLRSETRGDGDGNAVGDEGLDETSDVFRDRVLVSGETDVVSATRLDSVATAMSVSANVRARTCSLYASPARAPTMIAASEPPSSPASPAKARRSPRPRRGAGKASWPRGPRTPGAPPRAALSAAPRALAASSRVASSGLLESHAGLCSRVFGDTKSARVPRAIPAGLEPGAFLERANVGDAGGRAVGRSTRLASAEDVSDARRPIPSPAIPALETLSSGGGGGASSSLDSESTVHEVRLVAGS